MDFKIRQAIVANVAGESPEEITNIVEDAIAAGDEHLLPGLGVFLEKWWAGTSPQEHAQFADIVATQIKQ